MSEKEQHDQSPETPLTARAELWRFRENGVGLSPRLEVVTRRVGFNAKYSLRVSQHFAILGVSAMNHFSQIPSYRPP